MSYVESLLNNGFGSFVAMIGLVFTLRRPTRFAAAQVLSLILQAVALVMGQMLVITEMSCRGNCPHMPLEVIPSVLGLATYGTARMVETISGRSTRAIMG